jgi:hypothetical protein
MAKYLYNMPKLYRGRADGSGDEEWDVHIAIKEIDFILEEHGSLTRLMEAFDIRACVEPPRFARIGGRAF